MRRLVAATVAIWMLHLECVHAAALLSQRQARNKAIDILKGDPYGRTRVAAEKNIKSVRFARNGNTKACGPVKTAVWEFHIVVMRPDKNQFASEIIDGFLALDARTGKIRCANLPSLD